MKRDVKYIGILVANEKQKRRVLRTYQKVASKDMKVFTFTPSSIRWDSQTIVGLHYTKNGVQTKAFPFPSAVYNRCYGGKRRLVRRIEKRIGKNKCFNHVTHFDKQQTDELLRNTEVSRYLPDTLPLDKADLIHLLDKYHVLYLKPGLGNRGKGVYRVEQTEKGEIHISQHYFASSEIFRDMESFHHRVHKLTRAKKYIVQQGISFQQVENKNFDIRVLVQKTRTGSWGVTSVMSRTAYAGCFNTSVCERVSDSLTLLETLFPAPLANRLLQSIFDISLSTATLLEQNGGYHLGELSVDFGVDCDANPWLIEVNGNPQRTLFRHLKNYRDVYKNPLRYARYLTSKA